MAGSAPEAADPFAAVRIFEGKWQGTTSGRPGKGTTVREYRFELGGKFLTQRDHSAYRPEDASAPPVDHEDFGVFSYDANLRKIVWRQFHSEGFVNEYVLEASGEGGRSLEFVAARIENLPGYRAKKAYRIRSQDEVEETFSLAPPESDFAVYTVAHLRRSRG